ncbi:hypothetical protein EAE96_006487 [Botrytis aclada]|nr:hypothetical protein EAE96_006487 [Botrytis aclada]
MTSPKLRSGWDTEGALRREELDPAFAFPQYYEESWFPLHKGSSFKPVPRPPISIDSHKIYQYAMESVPSADEYRRVRLQQQQQRQQQQQGPKPAPPSPTVSLISTYGLKPTHEAPNVRDKSHHYVQRHQTAGRYMVPPVGAQRKPSVSNPAPQKVK